MIDIIIPAYNAHNTIERTLYSIAYQDIIDQINVYIVDDCSNKNYNDIVNFFKNIMNIKELTLKTNQGPGVARQYGIDNSYSKYIVFIDSDDVFSNCYAIKTLLNSIKKDDCDISVSTFAEETEHAFINHENDTIWLHGKIYKRKFLKDNKIKFNNSRANEDNGFNQLILLHDHKINYISSKTYIWCNNKKSITRSNNHKYRLDGLEGYVYNINWALEQAISTNCDNNKIAELSFASLVAMYYYFLEFQDEKLLKISNCLLEKSNKYNLTEEKKINILEQQFKFFYNKNTRSYLLNPIITLKKFKELINKEKYD